MDAVTKTSVAVACACALALGLVTPADARRSGRAVSSRDCASSPEPTPTRDLPAKLQPYGADERFIGDGTLWTVKPRRVVQDPETGTWILGKQPWFRLEEGPLRVDARRVDGGTGTFRARIPRMESYPLDLNLHVGPGFIPSSLEFSSPGCWKVTARLGTSKVVLHVDVER
jgi:hypothetical protein